MKLFKTKCFIMALITLISTFSVALAATFPDVTKSNYSWAMEAVEEMAAQKIILGYENGTFRPANTITKLEALVLIARVLGVDNSVNDEFVEIAFEKFGKKVSGYNLPYGTDEICYLLARGVMAEKEMPDYISSTNASKGLKRYEVAVLLTKAMGAEETVKDNVISVLDYSDESDIPSFAKKYVEYVTETKLMQGMENNTFSPNTNVNRAQMAVVLHKLINLADYSQFNAIVSTVDNLLGVIRLKSKDGNTTGYTIRDKVMLRFEGEKFDVSDITVGLEAVVTTSNGELFSIDFMTPNVEIEVTGSVINTRSSAATGSTITIKQINLTDTKEVTYTVNSDALVTYNGKNTALTSLKAGDFVTLSVVKGKVTLIKAEPKSRTVKGIVKDLVVSNNGLVLKINNSETEKDEEYTVANEIKFVKNTKPAELSTLRAGDSVSMVLEYDIVAQITAMSKSSTGAGYIESIFISANASEVTLKMDGVSVTYPVSKDAEVTVNGKKGNIYDLRLSATANVSIESDEIVKITVNQASEVEQFTGTVDLLNVSYGLMQITYHDVNTNQSITRQVFVGNGTKIVNNSTGKDVTLKTLTPGITVTVIGSVNTGVFEATTVIVLG